ncbi:MAG: DUF2846 domain-containing protein [Casimicrobium sp.]
MKNTRRVFLALCIVAVAGCASGPKFSEMQSKMPTMKAGEGRIYVYRDSVFGAAVVPAVYVNGVESGRSLANSFFYVDRAPGEYKISATTEVEKSVSFALAAGESKYVKVSIGMGLFAGRPNFELVNEAGARTALQSLSYSGK